MSIDVGLSAVVAAATTPILGGYVSRLRRGWHVNGHATTMGGTS